MGEWVNESGCIISAKIEATLPLIPSPRATRPNALHAAPGFFFRTHARRNRCNRSSPPADPSRRPEPPPTNRFPHPNHIPDRLGLWVELPRRSLDKSFECGVRSRGVADSGFGIPHSAFESSHSSVLLIGFEAQAHENVIVGDGLHVLDVIFQGDR